jgi:hypothetical protein
VDADPQIEDPDHTPHTSAAQMMESCGYRAAFQVHVGF